MTETELQMELAEFQRRLLLYGRARHPTTGEIWIMEAGENFFFGKSELGDLADLSKALAREDREHSTR